MDPLSVTASVVGLLSGAAKIVGVLHKVKTSVVDAPMSLGNLLSQVNDLERCLAAVNQLLTGMYSAPAKRSSMIQVDQLVATLTEAVLTFSELESLIMPLGDPSEISIRQRMEMAWKEENISSIMNRLERHKSSFSLMLNIIQCATDMEAERSREQLHDVIRTLLQSNYDILDRLHQLEVTYDSESVLTTCFRNNRGIEDDSSTTDTIREDIGVDRLQSEASFGVYQPEDFHFSFESDLDRSRVYKRTQPYTSDASFSSSAVRTHAWSIFSGLSLSQVSSMSAIALPVHADEIYNYKHYRIEVAQTPLTRSIPTGGFLESALHVVDIEAVSFPASGDLFNDEQGTGQPDLYLQQPGIAIEDIEASRPVPPDRSVEIFENFVEEGQDIIDISNEGNETQPAFSALSSFDFGFPIAPAFEIDPHSRTNEVRPCQILGNESEWSKPLSLYRESSTPRPTTKNTFSESRRPFDKSGTSILDPLIRLEVEDRCLECQPDAKASTYFTNSPAKPESLYHLNKDTSGRLIAIRSSELTQMTHIPKRPPPLIASSESVLSGSKQPLFKISILGHHYVGKTTIAIQFCHSLFVDFYIPKADNIYQRTLNIDGLSANLQVLDSPPVESSGQEIQDGEGFMLLYSITDRESFKYVRYLYDQILRMKARNRHFTKENEPLNDEPDPFPPIVLVANKSDKETLRQVSSQEGRSLADKLNCKFCETSARENWNVEEAFYKILPPSQANKLRMKRKSEIETFIEDPHMNSGKRKAKRRVQIRWPTRSSQQKAGFKVIRRFDA